MVHPYWKNICDHIRDHVLPSAASPIEDRIVRGNMFCDGPFVEPYERPFINDDACDINTAHQKYHLYRLEQAGVDWREKKTVLEFGGGYGCMASLVGGDYTIYDLPEMCRMQRKWLGDGKAKWATDIDDVRDMRPDLMLAMWSLTECDIPFRLEFLEVVKPRMFWLAQNRRFEDIDNTRWLSDVTGYQLSAFAIDHLPGHQYVLGVAE